MQHASPQILRSSASVSRTPTLWQQDFDEHPATAQSMSDALGKAEKIDSKLRFGVVKPQLQSGRNLQASKFIVAVS